MRLTKLNEGMNKNKQKGMLSKDHLEKALSNREKMIIGDDIIWMVDHSYMLNGIKTKFTQIYQAYRKYYKTRLQD
jgi:hypothetical protein